MSAAQKIIYYVLAVFFCLPGLKGGEGLNGSSQIILIDKGKSAYSIVVSENAAPAEQFAAEELGEYLEKITSVKLPVEKEKNSTGRHAIYVGQTDFARRNQIPFAELGEEEWIIRTIGQNVILSGGKPRGTIYAVYEFLERYLGCRWFDLFMEKVPSSDTVAIPPVNVRQKPAFDYREIYTRYQLPESEKEKLGLFVLRNKGNDKKWVGNEPRYGFSYQFGSPANIHTFGYYINSNEYFETHPEYFSMNRYGDRGKGNGVNSGYQLCFSNPEVRKLMIEKLRGYIKQDRLKAEKEGRNSPSVYDISQNDGGGEMCCCPECRKILEKTGSITGQLMEFINHISDGIKDEYPEIFIQTFAYNNTLQPSETVKPNDNVIIRYCDSYTTSELFRPLSHEFNRTNHDLIKGWGAVAKNISIWDYWRTFEDKNAGVSVNTPWVNIQALKPDLAFFSDSHAKLVFVECESYSPLGKYEAAFQSFYNLKLWLGYKLMQNPHQDDQPLIDEFFAGYYGPASTQMKEYFTYLQDRINSEKEILVATPQLRRKYLDLEFFARSYKLLDEADKQTSGLPRHNWNVKMEYVPVDSALLNLWESLERTSGKALPFDKKAILDRYKEITCRYADIYFRDDLRLRVKKVIDDDVAIFSQERKNPPIPEKFNCISPANLVDYIWNDFSYGHTKLMEDKDAAGGKACVLYEDPKWKNEPFVFGVYNPIAKTGVSGQLAAFGDIHKDGRYHWYKCNKAISIPQTGFMYLHWTWKVRLPNIAENFYENNRFEVYVSAKFLGPRYHSTGSGEADSIWIDRVILVKQ
jgi:hypothetical protein